MMKLVPALVLLLLSSATVYAQAPAGVAPAGAVAPAANAPAAVPAMNGAPPAANALAGGASVAPGRIQRHP